MQQSTVGGAVEGAAATPEKMKAQVGTGVVTPLAFVEALFKISVMHGENSRHPRGLWSPDAV